MNTSIKRIGAEYLAGTELVDLHHPDVQQKAAELTQGSASDLESARRIYHFVRDRIPYTFTHNLQKASDVLKEGKGQCNTKTTLTIALLRAAGIPARYRCASISKQMFKNVIPAWAFPFTPKSIPGHCWPEVYLNDRWTAIENIVDLDLYRGIQRKMEKDNAKVSIGCGLSEDNYQENWDGRTDILMQGGALTTEAGSYANADEYLKQSEEFLNRPRKWLKQKFVRPAMNRKFQSMRNLVHRSGEA